jgi:hypothetical protein
MERYEAAMIPHGKKPGLLIVIGKSKKGPRGLPSPKEDEDMGPSMDEEVDEGMGEGEGVGAELGHGLADALRARDGQGIYDAIEAIVRECERKPHAEGPHLGGEEEEEAY